MASALIEDVSELEHQAARLDKVFASSLGETFNTLLRGGYSEPLYQPRNDSGNGSAIIGYRADYFASALHEVAHWCIAGGERRTLIDYGYWYAPDGRDTQQQKAFEEVEYKPQALEWYFSRACGFPFKISVDNIDLETGELPDTREFKQRVLQQAKRWQYSALPSRGQIFFAALCREFGLCDERASVDFDLAELD